MRGFWLVTQCEVSKKARGKAEDAALVAGAASTRL